MPTTMRESRATDDIEFIRHVMERAVRFNAVPGLGLMIMGATAVASASIAAAAPPALWLPIWVGDAVLAFAIGLSTMIAKARSVSMPINSRAGQSFVLSFAPPILIGTVATVAVAARGAHDLLPPLWLSLYGLAAITAGAFSVRLVSIMGGCFLVVGAVAFLLPSLSGDLLMAAGFGVLHLVFGAFIAQRHGG